MYNNPDFSVFYDVSPRSTQWALGALRLLRPHRLAGAEKIRLGRFNDGGYVMIDRFEGTEAAYSLGINDDVSWDMDIARLGIPIFQYDHTIEALPDTHPLFHWEKKGISGVRGDNPQFATLEDLIVANGHAGARNMILKCDIEGAEWLLFDKTSNAVLRQFRQIVIEIHSMDYLAQPGHADNLRKALLNMTASHKVVHIHANNFAPWATVGGVAVPNVLELTLMRDDEGTFEPSDEIFPTAMDMPCNSGSADLYLGRFEF